MSQKIIITIGREFGSGGREIGKKLAENMGIDFYDKELITLAAKESGMSKEVFESIDETATSSLLYSLSLGNYRGMPGTVEMPLNDKLFLFQSNVIKEAAQKGSCVIVGRCADYILRKDLNSVHLFIHAPMVHRIERISKLHNISSKEAEEMIKKVDKKRAAYYNFYSSKRWGSISNFHLCVDSSVLGVEGTAEVLQLFAEKYAQK